MFTPTPSSRKAWIAPEIVLEKELIARAQDPGADTDTDSLGSQSGDPFLGPMSASGF